MPNQDTWNKEVAANLRYLYRENNYKKVAQLDIRYGIWMAAILWPILNHADLKPLFAEYTGIKQPLLLQLTLKPGDMTSVAAQLDAAAKSNPALKAEMDIVLACFLPLIMAELNLKEVDTATRIKGDVSGEIVNIGGTQIFYDAVTIVKNNSVFSTVPQVMAFMGTIIAVAVVVVFIIYLLLQPAKMKGNFNIAVAQFTASGAETQQTARDIRNIIFTILNREYALGDFGSVEVARRNIGQISSEADARQLAARINADMVIYGDVLLVDGEERIEPHFFIADTFKINVDELLGDHKLPLVPADETDTYEYLQRNTTLIVEFTKALSYLASENYRDAERSVASALAFVNEHMLTADGKVETDGRVVYLFGSVIALLEDNTALAQSRLEPILDPANPYGRAYIAQGNIYYHLAIALRDSSDIAGSLENFNEAARVYEEATTLENQPDTAFIDEKGNAGLGNVYFQQYQMTADALQKAEYADLARTSLENVIESYEAEANSNYQVLLLDLTSTASFTLGILLEREGDVEAARIHYQRTIDLNRDSNLVEAASTQLANLPDTEN